MEYGLQVKDRSRETNESGTVTREEGRKLREIVKFGLSFRIKAIQRLGCNERGKEMN